MGETRTILRNIFSNWVAYLISVIIGLVLSPVVVHSLGNNLYGIWAIIVSFSGYYGLVNLGITPSVSYYLSHYYARNDVEQVNRVASTAQTTLGILSLFVMVIALLIAVWGVDVFSVDPSYVREFRWAVLIMAANFALGFVFAVQQGFFVVLQRYDIRNAIQISTDVLRSVLIYWVLKSGYAIIEISLITFICTILNYCCCIFVLFKMYPPLNVRISYFRRRVLGQIVNYGAFAMLGELARQLMFYSSVLVIGYFLNAAAVTFYAIAGSLIDYSRNFLATMTRVFFPVATQSYSRDEIDKLQTLFLMGTKYTFLIALLIIIGYMTMGKQFIILWMGKEYASSYKVLLILSIGYIPYFLSYASHQVMLGMKRVAFMAQVNGIAAIVNLGVSILLVRGYGIEGVAWGTTAALFVNSGWVINRCRMMLNISCGQFIRTVLIRPLLCAVPIAVLGMIFQQRWFADIWVSFAVQVIVISCCFLIMVSAIGVERDLIVKVYGRFVRR